jgi:hypothetical protein
MTDKMTMQCPACETSSLDVLAAFLGGHPCPVCELPHEAAAAISAVRSRCRTADGYLVARFEQAITRATRAEVRADRYGRLVGDLRDLVERYGNPERDDHGHC